MQGINGCAFCRSNRKSWTDHTVEVCVELANVECGYCHQKGHTPKKCPKSALKKQREEEWAAKQAENKKRYEERQQKREAIWPALPETKGKSETVQVNKKSDWSSIVVNSLSAEEREQMEKQHHEQRERESEERRKEAERKRQELEERKRQAAEKKRQWEIRNQRRLEREYGLSEDNGICPAGSFWYFFIEGTKDDTANAKFLRENSDNQWEFKKYLKEKYYWLYWLSRSEYTEDNCPILDRWRWEEEQAEYEREERENAEVDRYCKEQEDIRNAMEAKLEKGEITLAEYNDWKWERDMSDDDFLAAESDRYWSHNYYSERDYKAWEARSEARKKK